jgi:nitrate/nitrite-specific signal transduction histidine kinase
MLDFIKKWRWGFLGLLFLVFCLIEIAEIRAGQPFNILDFSIYLSLIVTTGILLNFLLRAHDQQEQMTKLLESKYKLAQALTTHIDWQDLTAALAEFPAEVTAADQSVLLLKNPISQQFESVAGWRVKPDLAPDPVLEITCTACLDLKPGERLGLKHFTAETGRIGYDYFSLPIQQRGDLFALIQFRMKPGTKISDAEREIFENVTTDLGIALSAGHDRTLLAEMRANESTSGEQPNNPAQLYAHLDQHIGPVRARLNHLKNNTNLNTDELRTAVAQISDSVNTVFQTTQGDPKNTHPDTPHLNGLLHELARKASQRAGFILTFKAEGRQLPLEAEMQKGICTVFQEAFNNIEKHARATKVSVFVGWAFDILTVSITDNGVGFDAASNKSGKHLGLERMQERIDALGGQIDLRSASGEGSTITFIVPGLSQRAKAQA